LAEHGISPHRLRLALFTVDEGKRFADFIQEFDRDLRENATWLVGRAKTKVAT